MLDVAIIGGGLAALALAHSLHARRVDWALFESRSRLGGRVLTRSVGPGVAVDLGATWYWPATQPSMTRLVEDLELASRPQPDTGQLLWLDDPNREPRLRAFDARRAGPAVDESVAARPGALHGGARRLVGGMGALIDALAQRLPASRLHVGYRLLRVADAGGHVGLEIQTGPATAPRHVEARRVVLALPPRLALSQVVFLPALPAELQQALAAAPTWMAAAAKAALACAQPLWRDAPHAGNAWVTHPQAVLAEVFDAGPGAGPGALAGFLALDAARRREFQRSLPLLVESQFAMLFGAGAQGELLWQDWAEERDTCSAADLADDARPGVGHPVYGDPRLAVPYWDGRLWWAGSETARSGGGYLEGALGAAARVRRGLAEAGAGAPAG